MYKAAIHLKTSGEDAGVIRPRARPRHDSSRAMVFDRQGNVVSVAQKEFGQIYPQPGWVEQPLDGVVSRQGCRSMIRRTFPEGKCDMKEATARKALPAGAAKVPKRLPISFSSLHHLT
jgi:hypothetical protein